ncbi:diguanylate cyclase domain-containing protein [Vogesella amnigena]|uniref:diguanylate cyclase n=1 Tax=Vogesella amnigena TaxID=1507449 RepID=A0ABV7TP82_9NEIS
MNNSQTILVVDDVEINLHLLQGLLQPDHRVLTADNGPDALRIALEQQPDLILLDVILPGMDGYEVLQRLRADVRTKHIPVIFVTALNSAEEEARGLEFGAVDYITKPLNAITVRARVATHLKLERQRRMLEALANIDGLTELPNRRQLDSKLQAVWDHAVRSGSELSVAVIDVDCFKQYNDSQGHARGDNVLRLVARTISSSLQRSTDFAARYGGEEFVVLLPATPTDGAWLLMETLRRNIERLAIPHPGSTVSSVVSISVGVAGCTPLPQQRAASLLQKADQRLYHAKRSGRNCVVGDGLHSSFNSGALFSPDLPLDFPGL